ncbi:MAG TPA: 3-oxoacyl-ACP reductase FabG [Firmicutes bacterium]|nr:3-oxoacyl-ACP reductase FabG [Bacillota bacterium]
MKTVLITGGSRGIGAAAARAFAQAGWKVAINYCRSAQAAQALAAELCAQGGQALVVPGDVAVRSQVVQMVETVRKELGDPDLLINNAGISQQALFTDLTEEDWDRMFAVHVKGAFHCCQEVLPAMIRRRSGQIINISSMWGQVGGSCEVHYSAAKAALIGFTKALAKEVGPSQVRVNCVAPGVIATEMNGHLSPADLEALREETPLEIIGAPEDVASLLVFLASDQARFITGQVIAPNGGIVI